MANSFGEYLRQQRESREFSLEQVSGRTRIQKKFLVALEQDRLDQLPGRTFARGFIRAYAEAVGLNPEQTLVRFEESQKELRPPAAGEKPAAGPEKKKPLLLILVLLLAAAAVLTVTGLVLARRKTGPDKKPLAALPKSVPPKPLPAAPAPGKEKPEPKPAAGFLAPPFTVNLKAVELCWVLATADGKSSKEIMLYPGDGLKLQAAQSLSLLIGNAGGVEITVNAVKLKPVGGHWKPVRFLVPEDLPKYLAPEIPKAKAEELETAKPETPKAETVKTQSPGQKTP